MTISNQISFNIDFTSDYRLSGWALDIKTQKFPKQVQLRAKNGMSFDITDKDLIVRTDVCEKNDVASNSSLGFEINLLDIFNDRLHDYSIFIEEEKIWSQEKYFACMDHTNAENSLRLSQHYGKKQVIVIYQLNGWLHILLQKIHTLNATFFDKNYQSGISFTFITASEFGKEKDRLLKNAANSLFIIEQTEFQQTFGTSPTLLSKWPVIFLNEKINTTNDLNGLLSVITLFSQLDTEVPLKASSLAIMLTTISAYSSLIFDNQSNYYSYQSGTPKKWMGNVIRSEIQKKTQEDVIILSSKPINSLTDLDPRHCAVFTRTSTLRFIIDSLNKETLAFIKTVYKRGLQVKIMYEGEMT